MGKILVVGRLAARDLRHRPVQAAVDQPKVVQGTWVPCDKTPVPASRSSHRGAFPAEFLADTHRAIPAQMSADTP